MIETIDEVVIQGAPPKWARRAIIMLGLSILMYVLFMILAIGYDNELQPSYSDVEKVVITVLISAAALIAIYGLVLSISAFKNPKEKGVLKYLALLGNGVLSMIFGLISLANGLDLLREFFS